MTRAELVALQGDLEAAAARPGLALADGRFVHVWPYMLGQWRILVSRDVRGYEIETVM